MSSLSNNLWEKLALERDLHEIARLERDKALAELISLRERYAKLEQEMSSLCEEHARMSAQVAPVEALIESLKGKTQIVWDTGNFDIRLEKRG